MSTNVREVIVCHVNEIRELKKNIHLPLEFLLSMVILCIKKLSHAINLFVFHTPSVVNLTKVMS